MAIKINKTCCKCKEPFSAIAEWQTMCRYCYTAYKQTISPKVIMKEKYVLKPDKASIWLKTNIDTLLSLCSPDLHKESELSKKIHLELTNMFMEDL